MSLIRKFLDRIGRPPRDPIVIESPWGQVSEPARRQAALNMRDDLVLRTRCEQMCIDECGGDLERGIQEMHRRYPEAYELDRAN